MTYPESFSIASCCAAYVDACLIILRQELYRSVLYMIDRTDNA